MRLKIQLICGNDTDNYGFCNSSVEALIQRVSVLDSVEESENLYKNRPDLTLLNVAMAPTGLILKDVGMLLSRLENLSQVLVWNEMEVTDPHQACSIDLIEVRRHGEQVVIIHR